MDEQTRGFRSAIFGGFNREDVMHYIEETDTKYYTETAELRSQLTVKQGFGDFNSSTWHQFILIITTLFMAKSKFSFDNILSNDPYLN